MSTEDSAFDEVMKEEEDTYDFNQILDTLTEHRDIILTVPDEQIPFLRKGLSIVKAKRNAKFKEAGLLANTDIVTYTVYKTEEDRDTVNSKVRIKLGPRSGITILKMEIPDDTF